MGKKAVGRTRRTGFFFLGLRGADIFSSPSWGFFLFSFIYLIFGLEARIHFFSPPDGVQFVFGFFSGKFLSPGKLMVSP